MKRIMVVTSKDNAKRNIDSWLQAQYELEQDQEYQDRQHYVQSVRTRRNRHISRRQVEHWRVNTGFTWLWVLCTIFIIIVLAGNYQAGHWHTVQDLYVLSDMAHFGMLWLVWGTLTMICVVCKFLPQE